MSTSASPGVPARVSLYGDGVAARLQHALAFAISLGWRIRSAESEQASSGDWIATVRLELGADRLTVTAHERHPVTVTP